MEIGKEYFGCLWRYVDNPEITDIDFNGSALWLTNIYNERYCASENFVAEHMTDGSSFPRGLRILLAGSLIKGIRSLRRRPVSFALRFSMRQLQNPDVPSAFARHPL